MTSTEPAAAISELSSTLESVAAVLNPDAMSKEADRLREEAGEPGLWADQERGQAVTRRLSYLEGELARLDKLRRRLDDTRLLFELAESENDEPTREEAAADLAALRNEIDQLLTHMADRILQGRRVEALELQTPQGPAALRALLGYLAYGATLGGIMGAAGPRGPGTGTRHTHARGGYGHGW